MVRQKRKIGSAAEYIVPLGIIGVLGFVAYKFLGLGPGGPPGTGLSVAPGTGGNNAGTQQANAQSTANTLAQQAAAGQAPTLPDVTLQGMASQIFLLGNQQTPDIDGISNQLTLVGNLTDLTKVIQYFGTKAAPQLVSEWTMCGSLGLDCTQLDLPSFVRLAFNQSSDPDAGNILAGINSYYQEFQIKYQF